MAKRDFEIGLLHDQEPIGYAVMTTSNSADSSGSMITSQDSPECTVATAQRPGSISACLLKHTAKIYLREVAVDHSLQQMGAQLEPPTPPLRPDWLIRRRLVHRTSLCLRLSA